MTRHEIEKKLTEMAEEIFKFYHDNVQEGGNLSIYESNKHIVINNEAAFDDKYRGVIDVFVDEDGKYFEVYSMGNKKEYGNILRTKKGEWLV